MRILKATFIIIICALITIFTVENLEVLSEKTVFKLDLKFWGVESAPLPLGVYLFIVFFLGFIIGVIITLGINVKRRKRTNEFYPT